MDDAEIKKIFARKNAILTDGHFVYAEKEDGWYHGTAYVAKDAIYTDPHAVFALCGEMARRSAWLSVEVVVGPTIGGVVLSHDVAYHLGKNVAAVFVEEEDVLKERRDMGIVDYPHKLKAYGEVMLTSSSSLNWQEKIGTRRVIKRGYGPQIKGKRCLVVEDIVNSGLTAAKTITAIHEHGGIVVGVIALCDRSGGKVKPETLDAPLFHSLLELDLSMVREEDCPQCKDGVPVNTQFGKGMEFLQRTGKAQ